MRTFHPTTSNQPSFSRRQSVVRAGFTLIEVMIVLVIVGGMTGMVISRMGGRRDELRAALRNLTVVIKTLHEDARLRSKTYRLVIKMGGKQSSYSIESTTSDVVLKTAEEKEALEKKKKDKGKEASKEFSDGFSEDKSIMKKEKPLPKDFFFNSLEQADMKQVQTEGAGYIYFFPQGLTQESVIEITDKEKKMEWSIYVSPLSGEARLYSKFIKLSEVSPNEH